jgi:hypothetical protein
LEEDNDLVYQQFKEQRKIEKSLEAYDSNTYLKPLFRSNHILEKLYEERVNDDDDDEINNTENHFNCFVDVDIDADNFNVKDVNEDIIDLRPTVVEEVCDNSYESNVLFCSFRVCLVFVLFCFVCLFLF